MIIYLTVLLSALEIGRLHRLVRTFDYSANISFVSVETAKENLLLIPVCLAIIVLDLERMLCAHLIKYGLEHDQLLIDRLQQNRLYYLHLLLRPNFD